MKLIAKMLENKPLSMRLWLWLFWRDIARIRDQRPAEGVTKLAVEAMSHPLMKLAIREKLFWGRLSA